MTVLRSRLTAIAACGAATTTSAPGMDASNVRGVLS